MINAQLARKSGQLARFILKVARLEALIYKGLRAYWPDGQVISYLFFILKIFIYNKYKKKSGQLANEQK